MKITIYKTVGGFVNVRRADVPYVGERHAETGLIYSDSEIDREYTMDIKNAYMTNYGQIAVAPCVTKAGVLLQGDILAHAPVRKAILRKL